MAPEGGINISDLAGLSQPLVKLIETVSSGIGKVYEPWHTTRMARAKTKELKLISEAINNNIQLPVKYDNGSITIDVANANDLVQRAQVRFLFQEMQKQQNIDAVIDVAYGTLEKEETVEKTPVDIDWILHFFDSVSNISNEQMQQLWGKLLSGEVAKPGSFSLRTLDTLKTIAQKEAIAFKKISQYVLRCPGNLEKSFDDFILLSGIDWENCGISFPELLLLIEAGLILPNSDIAIGFDLQPNESEQLRANIYAISVKNISPEPICVRYSAFLLSEAGRELLSVITELPYEEDPFDEYKYLENCTNIVKKHEIPNMLFDLNQKILVEIVKL